jgi:hypothetical protein
LGADDEAGQEGVMAGIGPRNLLSKIGIASALLFSSAGLVTGQDLPKPATPNPTSVDDASDVHALAQSVRELQAQVQALNSEVTALRTEAGELRGQLDHAKGQVAPPAGVSESAAAYPLVASQPPAISTSQISAPLSAAPPQTLTLEDRIAQIEETQDLTAANLQEQSQTKVESGSKYRVRLSGIVLLNMFGVRGSVDNLDIPEIATQPAPFDSGGSFGGSLRQSQIGLEAFGPNIFGAHTSASIGFDFAGGFPNVPNGSTEGLVRLRTGTIRFDWTNTSVIAGQDYLFFAPLAPTSMASLALPALSYAGNLWSWTPQVRIEHRIVLSDRSRILLQGGILDSFSGDLPEGGADRIPSWGEMSGLPAFAGRVAWSYKLFGENLTIGEGGYYGKQFWGFGRNINGWAAATDLTLPLGKMVEFSGMFYRGSALGGLGGAIGQDVLFSGFLTDPTAIFKGLDSMGGWAQLKFKLRSNFEVNGAFGDDNPFAGELRAYPLSASYYGSLFSRNMSPFVNFIYRPRSDVVFSVEYRYIRTSVLDSSSSAASNVNASVGYFF